MDLSLSYNLLTGSIPSNFQEKNFKNNFDLSFNRLSGYLLSSFNASYDNRSLSLNNNRLSGFIPIQVHNMKILIFLKVVIMIVNMIVVTYHQMIRIKMDMNVVQVH